MRRLTVTLVSLWLVGLAPAWSAPCNQNGPLENALANAAANLGPGQWCEMTSSFEGGGGVSLYDFFYTCGFPDGWTAVYAASASWDSANHRLWWVGTPHGGSEGMVRYEASENTWYAEDYLAPLSGGATCTASAPWSIRSGRTSFPACNANHAYDSVGSFDGRYFYYQNFAGGSATIRRFDTQTKTWNNSWNTSAPQTHTGAVVYWPEHNSLVIAAGSTGQAWEVWEYDLDTNGPWTRRWSDISKAAIHEQLEYHPGTGEVVYFGGNNAPPDYTGNMIRFYDNGGGTSYQLLGTAPFDVGLNRSHCAADPGSSESVFICRACTIGAGSWYEFNATRNTWKSFSSLNITPPPSTNQGTCSADGISVVIPEYGVTGWIVTDRGGSNEGFYIYKHGSGGGGQTPPPIPGQLEAR